MEINFELKPGERVAPFDIDRAKSGAELRTRGGRAARFLMLVKNESYPVICIIEDVEGEEMPNSYTINGQHYDDNHPDEKDIFIIERIKEFWINVFNPPHEIEVHPAVYSSKEKAEGAAAGMLYHVGAVLVHTKVIEPVHQGVDYGQGESQTVVTEVPSEIKPKREYWASMWRNPTTGKIHMDTQTFETQRDADVQNGDLPPTDEEYSEYLGSTLVYED